MGRPTKLTPETHKAIVEAIGLGATYATAAACAGVSYDTFNEWMKAGDGATRKSVYSEFSEAVRKAEAECKFKATKVIIKAMADGEWKAALEFLRRRDPEWRDNVKQELTGPSGGPIEWREVAKQHGINPQDIEALAREVADKLNRAGSGGDGDGEKE